MEERMVKRWKEKIDTQSNQIFVQVGITCFCAVNEG
jgi:hypothetical protein